VALNKFGPTCVRTISLEDLRISSENLNDFGLSTADVKSIPLRVGPRILDIIWITVQVDTEKLIIQYVFGSSRH